MKYIFIQILIIDGLSCKYITNWIDPLYLQPFGKLQSRMILGFEQEKEEKVDARKHFGYTRTGIKIRSNGKYD